MSTFQIPKPDRLPVHLKQCPIVEAIMEIRFVTTEVWTNLPGLLYTHIRERYTRQNQLPLNQIPEDIRRTDPNFTYQPLIQYISDEFILQFGPRILALCTKPGMYPGWNRFSEEMGWLLAKIQDAKFVQEGERLGLRYIDFFTGDLFPGLLWETKIGETALVNTELSTTMVLKKSPFTVRLQVTNGVVGKIKEERTSGSILDLDVWLGATDFELFGNGMGQFNQAHTLVKEIFFGLLKPEFLDKLQPLYE